MPLAGVAFRSLNRPSVRSIPGSIHVRAIGVVVAGDSAFDVIDHAGLLSADRVQASSDREQIHCARRFTGVVIMRVDECRCKRLLQPVATCCRNWVLVVPRALVRPVPRCEVVGSRLQGPCGERGALTERQDRNPCRQAGRSPPPARTDTFGHVFRLENNTMKPQRVSCEARPPVHLPEIRAADCQPSGYEPAPQAHEMTGKDA